MYSEYYEWLYFQSIASFGGEYMLQIELKDNLKRIQRSMPVEFQCFLLLRTNNKKTSSITKRISCTVTGNMNIVSGYQLRWWNNLCRHFCCTQIRTNCQIYRLRIQCFWGSIFRPMWRSWGERCFKLDSKDLWWSILYRTSQLILYQFDVCQ